ncbi:unnamed protein product [Calypogeia fissa]
MRAAKLRSPVRDIYLGQVSPRSRNLAYLSRSASTQASSSKYGFRGAEQSGCGDEIKGTTGKRMNMLTRGTSFRRQGSSGMTWADNWIFTDDGMFLGRHTKVADDKGVASNGLRPITAQQPKNVKTSDDFPEELQRSRSVGAGTDRKHRSHHKSGLWGLKWLKKNLKKAFR